MRAETHESRGDMLIAKLAAAMAVAPNSGSAFSTESAVTFDLTPLKYFPSGGLFCPTCIEGAVCAFHHPHVEWHTVCVHPSLHSPEVLDEKTAEKDAEQVAALQVGEELSHSTSAKSPCVECWLNSGSCLAHGCSNNLHKQAMPQNICGSLQVTKDDEDVSTDVGGSEPSYAASDASEPQSMSMTSNNGYHQHNVMSKDGKVVWARGARWGIASRPRAR